jgi:hypothetical protein
MTLDMTIAMIRDMDRWIWMDGWMDLLIIGWMDGWMKIYS